MAIVDWCRDHWLELTIAISMAFNFASAIAALTATKKDDKIIAKIKTFVGRFLSLK